MANMKRAILEDRAGQRVLEAVVAATHAPVTCAACGRRVSRQTTIRWEGVRLCRDTMSCHYAIHPEKLP